VLALDTLFNREVLDHEEHGIYFQKDPREIARLIDRVDHDESLVDVFRSKARKRITERYTWEKITDQYEELFKNMIEPGSGKKA
jgi:glycosyltransferase involved in cell wall biosynthesis